MGDSKGQQQQPCHIYRLPNELLVEVLGHLERSLPRLSSTAEHRKAFLAICRLSKRFKSVGQRFLYHELKVSSRNERAMFRLLGEDAWQDAARACRALYVYTSERLSGDRIAVGDWATRMPNVEALAVFESSCSQSTWLDELCSFENLRHLDLSHALLSPFQVAFSFRHLVSLSLQHTTALPSPGLPCSPFSSAMFPVLRQLSVTRCDATGRQTVTDDLIGRPFLDQLDVILVDLGDHSLLTNGMVREPSLDPDLPVLWQSELAIGASLSAAELSQSSRVAHLLIRVGSHAAENLRTQMTSGHDRFRLFQQLHNLVQYQSHLRLLLVPPVLWNHVEHKCAPIGRWKGNTVGACQRRGIEVRTYDDARPLDGLVVPEFLEYLRDKAARKSA